MKLIVLGATGGTRIEIVRQTTPSRVTTRVSLGMKTTATLGVAIVCPILEETSVALCGC